MCNEIISDARNWQETTSIVGVPGDVAKFTEPCERLAVLIADRATPDDPAFRANEAAAMDMQKILDGIDLWSLTAIRKLYPVLLAIREEQKAREQV